MAQLTRTCAEECAGDSSARLSYADSCYAEYIVIQQGLKLVGWPSDIPFMSFGTIPGGAATLRKLLDLWDAREIRFERATPEDIANAKRDPKAVHPGWHQQAVSATEDATIVPSLVLHLEDMSDVGIELTSTQPSAASAVLGDRLRAQRSDTKKPRRRKLDGPHSRKRKLPKEGIKSEPYILPASAARRTPAQPAMSKPAGAHARQDWPVFDPVPLFRPVPTWSTLTSLNTFPATSYCRTRETGMDTFGMGAEGN